jgi:HEPN domain-containing protein
MRSPEEIRRELVTQWLTRAEEDLAVAQHLLAEALPYYAAIGFHAEQAAEKFIKAILVAHQIEFPKTHDLGRLLDLVATIDPQLSVDLAGAVRLTDYGVDVRYPGDLPELNAADARQAVEQANDVRDRIARRLRAE